MNAAVMLIYPHYHPTYGRFDHVLMLHDTNGWGFPGGLIGDDEALEQGARRIVMEQTGFRLDSELTLCSNDGDCAVFSAEVSEEFKPLRSELHDNDMWPHVGYASECPPSIFAPSVLAAINHLQPSPNQRRN